MRRSWPLSMSSTNTLFTRMPTCRVGRRARRQGAWARHRGSSRPAGGAASQGPVLAASEEQVTYLTPAHHNAAPTPNPHPASSMLHRTKTACSNVAGSCTLPPTHHNAAVVRDGGRDLHQLWQRHGQPLWCAGMWVRRDVGAQGWVGARSRVRWRCHKGGREGTRKTWAAAMQHVPAKEAKPRHSKLKT